MSNLWLEIHASFGLETTSASGKMAPARKRTRLMSNCTEVLKELGKLCPGDHSHQHLVSGRAKKAAIYPEGLCRAICRGLVRQIEIEDCNVRKLMNLSTVDKAGEVPESEEDQHQWQAAWEDVSGKEFNPAGASAAMSLEIEHVNLKNAWRK